MQEGADEMAAQLVSLSIDVGLGHLQLLALDYVSRLPMACLFVYDNCSFMGAQFYRVWCCPTIASL